MASGITGPVQDSGIHALICTGQRHGSCQNRLGQLRITATETRRDHVNTLVTRIAKFNADAIRATKKLVAQQMPTQAMFEKEAAFNEPVADPAVQDLVDKVLASSVDQSTVWVLNNSDNIVEYIG